MAIRQLFYFTALACMIGWILVIGKSILVPLAIAVMLTYVLIGGVRVLRRLPGLQHLPSFLAYMTVLLIFGLLLTTIVLISVSNLRDIAQSAPLFQQNLLDWVSRISALAGAADMPTWETLRNGTLGRVDLPGLSLTVLSSLASIGGYMVLIGTYVVFMIAERGPFRQKINIALPGKNGNSAAWDVINRINEQIVAYLSTKTLINVVLGVLSYTIMWLLGIENAVFWAFLIGLFNYIPYVGSLAGVMVVVVYVALLSGDLQLTIFTLALLTTAQVYVGNWLEPRIMSRSLNLSPLVVLAALVFWSSLWGVTGAILAVPLTSILMIVFAAFKPTRPITILLTRAGDLSGLSRDS